MRVLLVFFLSFLFITSSAQVYLDTGQTRHRFAQTALGADLLFITGGKSSFISDGNLKEFNVGNQITPRVTFSGIHFWGRAEFYITLPLGSIQLQQTQNIEYKYSPGIEAGTKYYFKQLIKKQISPFGGIGFSHFQYKQNNGKIYGQGPLISSIIFPLQAGLALPYKTGLFELGATYYIGKSQKYYVDRQQTADFKLPPFGILFGYKHLLETTLAYENDYVNGETAKRVKELGDRGKLNSLTAAMGPSMAFFLKKSPYNSTFRPFLNDYKTEGIFPEFGLGYYHHKLDAHLNISYRGYKTALLAYGIEQYLSRQAFTLELYKFLFDYHGFVPFIGPLISREKLAIAENDIQTGTLNFNELYYKPGIIVGWDIRPDRLQTFILRSNIRYFPNLNLEGSKGEKFSFDQIEFNFIQLVIYLNRLFI